MILDITVEEKSKREYLSTQVFLVDRDGFTCLPKNYVVIDPLAPSSPECFSALGRIFLREGKYESYSETYYFPITGFFLAVEYDYIKSHVGGPTWWWPHEVP